VRLASSDSWIGYSHAIATAAFISSLDTASYQELVEDSIDHIGFQQNVNDGFQGIGRGGWDYNGPSDRSDNSINSWNWMALEGGEGTAFGIDAPDWILQESEYALVGQQTNAAGGQAFGYTSASPLNGADDGQATTCAGLSGLAALELENTVTVGDIIDDAAAPLNSIAAKRDSALEYMGDNWTNDSFGGLGEGNRGNFYAMWTCCRAFRLTEGTLDLDPDTLLLENDGVSFNWSTGEEEGSGNVPGAGEPREGYSHYLVRTQTASGLWPGTTYLGDDLETALALLCLNPTVFGPPQCQDGDGDGYGDPGIPQCENGDAEDCDDSDPEVNPGAQEICDNGIDDDCDGLIDLDDPDCVAICADDDGDGYGSPGDPECPAGDAEDCDDTDPAVNPGATEICDNGIDDDCDGLIDGDDPDCAMGGEGCSPGYWKQPHHFGSWTDYSPYDSYDEVFGVSASFGDLTLFEVLWQGGGHEKSLGRQAVAALLNAANPDVSYAYTTGGVIDIVQDAYASGDWNGAKAGLEAENDNCPLGRAEGEGPPRPRPKHKGPSESNGGRARFLR
jgi:hypothetical protein